ncbi:PAS domain S-box-containing protein [Pseudomonas sp. JAI115]|uniref:PAS domain-containing protein n=1 Tax=Pseudomonas sp. JAI115 TaxID=2723061 RepID=UPI001616AF51|nr:PAS domain-containing protein [Pseudomonas sp. JAI115]MBB6155477.1 PAS domain S-box-containing protein [Pseudomonas sp. JAI115]
MTQEIPEVVPHRHSLTTRALRLATLRIGLVSLGAGAISYYVNSTLIEKDVTGQLLLSAEQTLQRESLPFQEIKDLQRNFLEEFKQTLAFPGMRAKLIEDFEQIFYRHDDGSYTQRPGLFEGEPLADGRRFARMSATYAPDTPPSEDTRARFALSYLLSYKYGSSSHGRLFNFYGVVPEKGFPIYQDADIAKVFSYSGPDALALETYEFYARGFGTPGNDTLFTRMYWDFSNNAWMTTIATPDVADASGRHQILASVDVLLDQLMTRTGKPAMQGAYSSLFIADDEGTLIYHPDVMEQVKSTAGKASIRSLDMTRSLPLLDVTSALMPGHAQVVQTRDEIVAMGRIPDTPWVLAVHYPRALMTPAIVGNLMIVVALGLLTLLVEILILRSILQKQVAIPLFRLIAATRQFGAGKERLCLEQLPTQSVDEVGELARAFGNMVERVQGTHDHLEHEVRDRVREARHLEAIAEERKRAEKLLLESEQRYRDIFDHSLDPLFLLEVTDEGLRFIEVNPAFESAVGVGRSELIGKTIEQTLAPQALATAMAKYQRCVDSDAPLDEEEEFDLPAGLRTFHTTLIPIRDAFGRVQRVVCIARDITERKHEERVLHSHRESTREEERKRIAREIHDELGQQLTALRMGVSLLRLQFGSDQPLLVERVQVLMGRIDAIIQVVRNVATSLRPAALDMGLIPALEWLVSEFSHNAGVACSLRACSDRLELDDERVTAIFRLIQESLTNVARHAQASHVEIHLQRSADHVFIEVRDDGKGFDPKQLSKRTLGMLGMRERGSMLGGTVSVDSAPGQGVRVQVAIPFRTDLELPRAR